MVETPLPTSTTTGMASGGSRFECFRLAVQVIRGRWFSLFASFLIMAGSGATYLFGAYSNIVKLSQGYDQTTLNLLGFFKDLGSNLGIISGLVAEVIPPWLLLLIGSAMNFGGYFMVWLAVTSKIPKPKVWEMCAYICVGANSTNFANTAAIVTTVRNFPENRGIVLGLLKCFTGLSGASMTQIYLAVYGNDAVSLILLIAWLPAAMSIVFVTTIRPIKMVSQRNELRIFYHFLYASAMLALFLMAMTISQKLVAFSKAAYAASASVLCVLLFFPLVIATRADVVPCNANETLTIPTSNTTILRKTKPTSEDKPRTSCFAKIWGKPVRGEDYTIPQALLSIDMLILFFAMFCGFGSCLTAMDNMGQIGESLGYPTKAIESFVSLLSIWNYFGRIFSGFVSEILIAKYKLPRPLVMAAALFLSCIGYLLIAFPAPGSVYVASVIIGFSFGAQLIVVLAISSEIFGLKHYPTFLTFAQLASPLGSYAFNVRVTGPLYDREAMKELENKGTNRSSVKELTCFGSHCYRLSFIVLACVVFSGAVASLVLFLRTRKFYEGDIYKKFREQAEEGEGGTVEIKEKASIEEEESQRPPQD